jgi:hypothetical protein
LREHLDRIEVNLMLGERLSQRAQVLVACSGVRSQPVAFTLDSLANIDASIFGASGAVKNCDIDRLVTDANIVGMDAGLVGEQLF